MRADWQTVRDTLKGQLVGGELIVRINKKNQSVGKLRDGVFHWTVFGAQLRESLIPPVAAASPPTPAKKRMGRPRKVKVEPDGKVDDPKL